MKLRALFARLDELVFLASADAKAKALSRSRAPALGRAAVDRLAVASQLEEHAATRGAAWSAMGAALELAERARAVFDAEQPRGAEPAAPRSVVDRARLDAVSARLAAAALDPDPLDDAASDALARDAAATVQALLEPIEIRSQALLRVIAVLRVVLLASLVGVVTWAIAYFSTAPFNVARGAPVILRDGTVDTASVLVDGVIEENPKATSRYGFMADALIDLGGPFVVRRVVVYGRGDYQAAEFLPLVVEASLDGVHYDQLGRRDDLFTAYVPWSLRFAPRRYRYVRVRCVGFGRIALSEVEVFGRKARVTQP